MKSRVIFSHENHARVSMQRSADKNKSIEWSIQWLYDEIEARVRALFARYAMEQRLFFTMFSDERKVSAPCSPARLCEQTLADIGIMHESFRKSGVKKTMPKSRFANAKGIEVITGHFLARPPRRFGYVHSTMRKNNTLIPRRSEAVAIMQATRFGVPRNYEDAREKKRNRISLRAMTRLAGCNKVRSKTAKKGTVLISMCAHSSTPAILARFVDAGREAQLNTSTSYADVFKKIVRLAVSAQVFYAMRRMHTRGLYDTPNARKWIIQCANMRIMAHPAAGDDMRGKANTIHRNSSREQFEQCAHKRFVDVCITHWMDRHDDCAPIEKVRTIAIKRFTEMPNATGMRWAI